MLFSYTVKVHYVLLRGFFWDKCLCVRADGGLAWLKHILQENGECVAPSTLASLQYLLPQNTVLLCRLECIVGMPFWFSFMNLVVTRRTLSSGCLAITTSVFSSFTGHLPVCLGEWAVYVPALSSRHQNSITLLC